MTDKKIHCWFNFGKFDVGVWEDILGLEQIFDQFFVLFFFQNFWSKKWSTDGN